MSELPEKDISNVLASVGSILQLDCRWKRLNVFTVFHVVQTEIFSRTVHKIYFYAFKVKDYIDIV